MLDTKALIAYMKNLAQRAGEKILEVYEKKFTVSYKDDRSPVTLADKEANDLIVAGLMERYPNIPVLAEESVDDRSRLSKDLCFVVDPLDGTKEFVSRNGEFTVNIALTEKGRPIAGVIHIPILKETYYACQNEGAYLDHDDQSERIHVSDRIGDIRLAVSRSHRSEELDKLIKDNYIQHIIVAGSAYKGCLLAKGSVEAYYRFGRTMEWDTAAMEIIVSEAGGVFKGMDGRDFTYNKADTANPTGFFVLNRKENTLNLLNSH